MEPAGSDCDCQVDLAWSKSVAGTESVMTVLVATATMEAAHQHLRGLTRLLDCSDVDLAIEALARACCEASGRALWVLDSAVESRTRAARALNVA